MVVHEKPRSARLKSFQETIWHFYTTHGRSLPWRETKDPYRILVSEIMLQQTQVERVKEKYPAFIEAFPDFLSLATAPLEKILLHWQGLGYNRRAIALKRIAEEVVTKHQGVLPSSVEVLMQLPGIGRATASAIAAFAFDQPTVFIETNIRRVFIHFFFRTREGVHDKDLLPLVERTLDRTNPREWYYALMDYGATLKKDVANPNRRSRHYQRQQPFEGSRRQARGLILKTILENARVTEADLRRSTRVQPNQLRTLLKQLQHEGFLKKRGRTYSIA